jgi:hypothetical protein
MDGMRARPRRHFVKETKDFGVFWGVAPSRCARNKSHSMAPTGVAHTIYCCRDYCKAGKSTYHRSAQQASFAVLASAVY